MVDKLFQTGDSQTFVKFKDMGDGSHAEVVYAENMGGGGGGGADREFVVSLYRAKNAFTGAGVGDTISSVQVIDVSGATPAALRSH